MFAHNPLLSLLAISTLSVDTTIFATIGVPIAPQHLKPLFQGNNTIEIGVYLPFGIYGVHGDANLYGLMVVPKNQNWNFFPGGLNSLL